MSKYDKNNSIQVRLGGRKKYLANESKIIDRSLNWIILSAIDKLPCMAEFVKMEEERKKKKGN